MSFSFKKKTSIKRNGIQKIIKIYGLMKMPEITKCNFRKNEDKCFKKPYKIVSDILNFEKCDGEENCKEYQSQLAIIQASETLKEIYSWMKTH